MAKRKKSSKSSSAKKLLNKVSRQLRRGAVLAFAAGLVVGGAGAWYWMDKKADKIQNELNGKNSELASLNESFAKPGDCSDPNFMNQSGKCPNINIVSSSFKSDDNLKNGQVFMVVQADFHNPTDQMITIDPSQVKLKDADNFVFTPEYTDGYGYDGTQVEYASISGMPNLLTTSPFNLAPGEKVRGNLFYKITDQQGTYKLVFIKSASEKF